MLTERHSCHHMYVFPSRLYHESRNIKQLYSNPRFCSDLFALVLNLRVTIDRWDFLKKTRKKKDLSILH